MHLNNFEKWTSQIENARSRRGGGGVLSDSRIRQSIVESIDERKGVRNDGAEHEWAADWASDDVDRGLDQPEVWALEERAEDAEDWVEDKTEGPGGDVERESTEDGLNNRSHILLHIWVTCSLSIHVLSCSEDSFSDSLAAIDLAIHILKEVSAISS